MGEAIGHECGVAIVRLKRPLAYYQATHGSALWGLRKLYLLMEKQRNRGQDGAGIAVLRLDAPYGQPYLARHREGGASSLDRLWQHIYDELARALRQPGVAAGDPAALKQAFAFCGEVYLGHLRYGTHGGYGVENCHPFIRASNWPSRTLCLAGNFNLTNTDEIFRMLVELGQHPIGRADTATVLEKIGHFLDVANEAIVRKAEAEELKGEALRQAIAEQLDLAKVLRRAARSWDGGYCLVGLVGHGAAFALRDPHGIRPGYWYEDEEAVVVASERAAIVTCFAAEPAAVRELSPGHALIIDHQGRAREHEILAPGVKRSCSFERIYFSRGNDPDIYRERKALGRELVPMLLAALEHDLERAVISYIPNTAEAAWHGLLEGLAEWVAEWQEQRIRELLARGQLTDEALRRILRVRARIEKAAHKDAKLRTFITGEHDRGDLVGHVYDITPGILRPGVDTIVAIDDSIVRGTTLRQSILGMLARLKPRRIVILSSAPQIRYPDCYGIDMSELGKFVAFEAAVSLLRERGQAGLLEEVLVACRRDEDGAVNHVKRIYEPFSEAEISARIAELVRPAQWEGELTIIFQSVAGLHRALPQHRGDWYFTGDYPTPGGVRICHRAFVNYMERRAGRAYEAAG
ncbi:MAG: class II glutamine amidotransferase [Planctomycetota bacterium]|nr:class II glutamine amidotransferase [Planctomycetota bacterium]MCX8040607.1 class II glutamine amidotransferase [Planctomycetota bacterium]MDW8373438.1 class II glutamine amidotransferase [Planctomycetota bacterium]